VIKEEVQNILVVRQHDQLGDMLCVIPLLRALHTEFPRALITLVASHVNYEIMLHHPYIDEVLNYDKKAFLPNIFNLLTFIRKLRSKRYDIAVVPVTVSISTTSNFIAWLSGATIRLGPESIEGKRNSSTYCFTATLPLDWTKDSRRHQTLRNIDILRLLHVTTDDLSCKIGLTKQEIQSAQTKLAPLRLKHPLLVGMHPGAGKEKNRWSAEKFATIANKLSKENNAGIIITAGLKDKECLQQIKQHLRCHYIVIENEPIRTVAAIIDQLDIFISNDTGIMHVAGGTSVSTLSLFGPTDPLQWAPVGKKNRFISTENKNIDSITVDEVYNIVELIIQELHRN